MPNWNSRDGVWTPAKESAVLKSRGTQSNPNGENLIDEEGNVQIYNGPCREATRILKEEGLDHLGHHYSKDRDTLEEAHRARKSLDEFTYTTEETKAERKKHHDRLEKRVVSHGKIQRKKGITPRHGGNQLKGGFGTGGDAEADAWKANQ